jgi:hypothetical protein
VPRRRSLDRQKRIAAGQSAAIRAGLCHVGKLGGQYPPIALGADGAANHFLGSALNVSVCRVDEIHALCAGAVDDGARGRLIGQATKHHGSEANR